MIERMIGVRSDHDETQRQLAAAIGYHQVQIARYETGVNAPPIDYLVKFCKHYHVSADYILGLPRNGEWPR
ncbi:MAG: helix-turn-helix transcriptional regulator [Deltaproteobacteria bacterium]|nr:helix-turn-helix transcriptional regulator [Deltaproteobacteria bacterium]